MSTAALIIILSNTTKVCNYKTKYEKSANQVTVDRVQQICFLFIYLHLNIFFKHNLLLTDIIILLKITFLNYSGEGAKQQHEPFDTMTTYKKFFYLHYA